VDVVKVNFPHPEKQRDVEPAYRTEFTSQQAIDTHPSE
jgi:class I fructose-bisphosphate aldolase